MDKVAFWPLKDKPQPVRSPDVPVVAELPNAAEDHGTRARRGTEPDQQVDDHAREQAVDHDFQRILIKGRQSFEPLSAVMNLMQPSPQKIRSMPPQMPPV